MKLLYLGLASSYLATSENKFFTEMLTKKKERKKRPGQQNQLCSKLIFNTVMRFPFYHFWNIPFPN